MALLGACRLVEKTIVYLHESEDREAPESITHVVIDMATLFGSLPSAAMRNRGRNTALVSSTRGNSSEHALQWVYDDETSNCMHCNMPFTLITRKVGIHVHGIGRLMQR